MMQVELVFAGFGGQGVMLMGKLLAYAGMKEGRQVCWMPSYGPEMRGGTANCTVVVSDSRIGSPIVADPAILVAMNLPSLDKFEPTVKKDGLILVNSSLIERKVGRDDCRELYVPANAIAIECGSPRSANMVMLGALLGAERIVDPELVEALIREQFAGKKPEVARINVEAFRRGLELGVTGGGEGE